LSVVPELALACRFENSAAREWDRPDILRDC
jgi:hypothetical protein